MKHNYEIGSQWQFLSPWWRFETDLNTKSLIWTLKDFGTYDLHLRFQNGVFEIVAANSWDFVKEELMGHIEMHLWCKAHGASISDPRNNSIQLDLSESGKKENEYLYQLLVSITQNFDLTELFYSINQKIKDSK